MDFQFSLAHLTAIHCPPTELMDIASETGYDFVSLRLTRVTESEPHFPLLDNRELMSEVKQKMQDTGIGVHDIELVRLDPQTEPESYKRFLAAGSELGARTIITQLPDPEQNRAVDRLGRLCELAALFDLMVDLEFPSWTEIPDLETAVTILEQSGATNGGILVDTLHFASSRSSLELLEKLDPKIFHFIHLCDGPEEIPDSAEERIRIARDERYFPGEGGLDLAPVLTRLPVVPYSLEIPNSQLLNKLGIRNFAARALNTSRSYLRNLMKQHIDIKE